jgi:hypothetical protein
LMDVLLVIAFTRGRLSNASYQRASCVI